MSAAPDTSYVSDYIGFQKKVAVARQLMERAADPFQSLDGAERVRLARLARFQRSSTATRKNNSPGSL